MFKLKQPFFNVDGATEANGDWMSIAQSAMQEETPADDVQPEPDTDAETVEETIDTAEVETDETDEAEQTEEEPSDEPLFNDETEIDLGEGRQPVKLAELKQGFLRQSDYTKKTQELAAQRKAFETEMEQMKPYKEWADYAVQNPYMWNAINEAINQFHSNGTMDFQEILADAEYGQAFNQIMAERNALQRELDSIKGEYEGIKITSEMKQLESDLKGEYGDLVTEEYISTLQERRTNESLPIHVLREIADGHLTRQKLTQTQTQVKQATKQAQAKTIQSLQEKRTALPPQPRSNGQRPANEAPDNEGMSWLDIAKTAGASMR